MSADTIIQASTSTRDAIEELRGDHRRIDRVLADCERLLEAGPASSSAADRSGLASRLGALLQAHMQVKHELFEPALRRVATSAPAEPAGQTQGQAQGQTQGQIHAAGHDAILARLAALTAAEQRPGQFADALAAFATDWRQHVQDEETQGFPAARRVADAQPLDLMALGTAIAQRRAELLGDQGVD